MSVCGGSFVQDVRYASRVLLRNRAFSAMAALTIALGVGLTAGVFALVDAVLLRPLPVAEPSRLVSIEEIDADGHARAAFSLRLYEAHRARNRAFASIAAHQVDELSYRGDAGAEVVTAVSVSDNYFATLGLHPGVGRFFTAGESDPRDGANVVVLAHDFWSARFAGEPAVIGRTMVLNRQPLTIVGVAPPGFRGTLVGLAPSVFVPLGLHARLHPGAAVLDGDTYAWLQLVGRLGDGVSRTAAERATASVAREIPSPRGTERTVRAARVRRLTGVPPSRAGALTGFLSLLLATAGVVLAIAAVNVVGMLLARAVARRREIAIRVAIGASRVQLARELVTETILLFCAGGAGGVLLAAWVADLLGRVRPPLPVPITLELKADARVLGFALLVALIAGLAAGSAPALHALRAGAFGAMRGGAAAGRVRARSALVSAQFALSLVLLVLAGLFVRSVRTALDAPLGFDPAGAAVAAIDLSPHGYDETRARTFLRLLRLRLAAAPGADAVGFGHVVPLGFSRQSAMLNGPGITPLPGDTGVTVDYNVVDAGFFDVLRIPLRAGRIFDERDDERAAPAAVVNTSLARQFWGNEDAIGRTIRRSGIDHQVIGVVEDGSHRSPGEPPRPYLYLALTQEHRADVNVLVRGADASAALAALRAAVRDLDPDIPLVDARPMEQVIALSLFPQRLAATLIGVFGILGLALAAVGIYGVMAYDVAQRGRELGVRMALGADRHAIRIAIVKRGLVLAGAGAAVGGIIAFGAARVLRTFLTRVNPADPLTFSLAITVLFAVAVAACVVPARRAAAVQPVAAMREE
jgi:predicted permease